MSKLGTPIRMGKIENQTEVINNGKRGNFNRHLTRSTHRKLSFPAEPIYEESDCRIRKKEQLTNAWLKKCQKIEIAGTLCGEMPLKFCDSKTVSLT